MRCGAAPVFFQRCMQHLSERITILHPHTGL